MLWSRFAPDSLADRLVYSEGSGRGVSGGDVCCQKGTVGVRRGCWVSGGAVGCQEGTVWCQEGAVWVSRGNVRCHVDIRRDCGCQEEAVGAS